MAIDRVAMPEQEGDVRARNFGEVNLGLTYQLAMLEAERCIQCPKPFCVEGCPVRVNIPQFIKLLRDGDLPAAAESLLADNALPCVTGRVCPQETPVRGRLHPRPRRATRWPSATWSASSPTGRRPTSTSCPRHEPGQTGKQVGIVGSGPAGLTAAGELAQQGHDVTVFEAFHAPGGVLIYGIPEFRLPKDIVQAEVDRLVSRGREDRVQRHRRPHLHDPRAARGLRRGVRRRRAPACRCS